jgi:hypothetical protein
MNLQIDVLKDWRLELPKQDIHVGDTIIVDSLYTKLMQVSGESTRYLECKNKNGIYIRYELNKAVANRGAGTSGTGVELVMPNTVPNVPATCRINITIEYNIYVLRTVIETANSKEFTLLPASQKQDASQKTSQTQVESVGRLDVIDVSYPNTTPAEQPKQQDISQKQQNVQQTSESETPPATPQPTILEQIIHPIQPLINQILGVL